MYDDGVYWLRYEFPAAEEEEGGDEAYQWDETSCEHAVEKEILVAPSNWLWRLLHMVSGLACDSQHKQAEGKHFHLNISWTNPNTSQ